MTDLPGSPSRLGPYPIEREIGRGGMGVVYLGRDTKLNRPVAIKVLPDLFARDPERLARFEREARLLASLNHPNIAGIYGLEEADGVRFLVLEYVAGETLADRLARGPLPVDETLEVCRQVAAAVESAHENGVIHRDLKPANVKLTPGGEVKVLDFGLAKGGLTSDSSSGLDLTSSPTRAYSGTVAGVILGTAAYMSPEQARGKAVDRRTDIWSFGCVLYECLTGNQAFPGETVSDMIAKILQGSPQWDELPADTPPAVRLLLERCLEKDAKKRLRDIGEARLELERVQSGESSVTALPAPAPAPRPWTRWIPWGVAAALAVTTALLAVSRFRSPPDDHPLLHLSIVIPGDATPFRDAALCSLSPDGTQFAFTATDSTQWSGVWLLSLGTNAVQRLNGTDGGQAPFWEPDGKRIGFFTADKLKKLDLASGAVEPLADSRWGRGGTWSANGTILYAPGPESPLFRISANGGTPVQVTTIDTTARETGHRYPWFLPDGDRFTYVTLPPKQGTYDVYLGSLDSPDRTRLLGAQGAPVYTPPGYLLYSRGNRIVAHRFDPGKGALIGEAISLGYEPSFSDWSGSPLFCASDRGALLLVVAGSVETHLAWIGVPGGEIRRLPIPAAAYDDLALSPDDHRALLRRKISATEFDLWLADLDRGLVSRFTFGGEKIEAPCWSRDGTRIAYSSDRQGPYDLYVKAANGASPEEPLYTSDALFKYVCDWSPDGKFVLFRQLGEKTGWDLWILPLEGDRTPVPYIRTPFHEMDAAISPDGRWAVYQSGESGQPQIYADTFPTPGHRVQISPSAGFSPHWRRDGKMIGYVDGAGSMVEVGFTVEGDEARVGEPTVLMHTPDRVETGQLTGDFSRALALIGAEEHGGSRPVTLVLNWPAALANR
jgi:eukaryotic-like serine/threonine-protein kinase